MSRSSTNRFGTYAILIGVVFVIGLAIPAWNRARLAFALGDARAALRSRHLDEAVQLLEKLQKEHPARRDVCYMLGVANRRNGRFERAFEHLQQAEKLNWPLSDITRQRYLARFQAGDIESTKGYLYTLLQEGVDDVVAEEIYEALAEGYLKQARIIDAIVVLDHWIEWQPQAVQARLWRAQLLETFAEDWIASAEHYRKILETDPNHSEARLRLATALFRSQKVEEAQKEYLAIRPDSSEHPLALLGLARCEQRLGKSSDAAKLFEGVVTADIDGSHRAEAWAELGQIALNDSDYERAVKCFESALEADPRQVQTHHLLGTTYSRLGEEEKARHHIELSQHVLKQFQRMSELADDITRSPDNVAPRMEMAKLAKESGDFEAAMRWLQTVLHIDPTHAEAREALANLFAEFGVHDMAAAHRRFATQTSQADTPTTPTE